MSSAPIPPTDGPAPTPTPVADGDGLASRPTATWRPWEAVAVYLLAILLGGFATVPFLRLVQDPGLRNLTSAAAAAVVIVGVVLAWLSTAHRTWRDVVGVPRRGAWWREIRASLAFGLLLYPGMVFGVGLVLSLVLSAIAGEPAEAPEQVPSGLSAVGVAVTAVYAVVVAPLHEELFFRGVLFRSVRDRYGLGSGLLASAVGFSLIHYAEGPWQDSVLLMGVMFFNGIALAWWYDRRGVLVAPVIGHMVFNMIGLSLIFAIG